MKCCTVCDQTKPLADFPRSMNARDGLRAECKACHRARAKANYVPSDRVGTTIHSECRHCAEAFSYVFKSGRARIYCSENCKYLGGHALKQRRSRVAERRCPCGTVVTTRTGKPVCDDCKIDRRPARREYERGRTLARYGLTQSDWDALVLRQGDRCAICQTAVPGGKGEMWHIDHDHSTDVVRGLLCHLCNVGLGNFRDSPALLATAIQYLSRAHLRSA